MNIHALDPRYEERLMRIWTQAMWCGSCVIYGHPDWPSYSVLMITKGDKC